MKVLLKTEDMYIDAVVYDIPHRGEILHLWSDDGSHADIYVVLNVVYPVSTTLGDPLLPTVLAQLIKSRVAISEYLDSMVAE